MCGAHLEIYGHARMFSFAIQVLSRDEIVFESVESAGVEYV